jgi:hypothetical protein
VLLGTAGRIASGLHQGMMEWLTENRTTLFGAYSSDRSRRPARQNIARRTAADAGSRRRVVR